MPSINTYHPDDSALRALVSGRLSPGERADMAAHLACCGACMERFIALQENTPAPLPPRGLDERILLQLQQQTHAQKQREFWLYCARVAVSTAAVVAMTFWVFTPENFLLYAQEAPPQQAPAVVVTAAPPVQEEIPRPASGKAPIPLFVPRHKASITAAGDPHPAPQLSQRSNGEL